MTTRFFEKSGGNCINPGPGTCVDSVVVHSKDKKIFDFYMVANENPTTATALPVHYEVAINSTQMSKDDIELMTYQQCYGYFGFSGPIKVPAVVKYAEKLAFYAYDNEIVSRLHEGQVNPALSNTLHFI